MTTPSKFIATIQTKTQLTTHVYELLFELQEGTLTYLPGQYATFLIDASTRRQYSFATPNTTPKQFTIVVDVTPMGPGSKYFLEKNVGDTVEMLAPLGTFLFNSTTQNSAFIATGTGIVPFRAMIEDYLMHGGTSEITLYWGLRFEEDIFWKDLFDTWSRQYPNFHYSIILSKPTSAWTGKIGHVTEHIFTEIPSLTTHAFYLCGNRHMIRDVQADLLAHNVPEGQSKTELF